MPEFLLPDLGEGLTEATILAWHVAVGDEVHVDQLVVEVETAKAAVEVPIPFSGVVTRLHVEVGQALPVGQPLISVTSADAPVGFQEPGIVTPPAVDGNGGSGNVLIGYGTSAPTRPRHRTGRSAGAAPAAAPSAAPAVDGRVAVVSPLVRKLARDGGVDLSTVRGSGPAGLVMRRDLDLRWATHDVSPARTRLPAGDGERRIPLTGVRRAVADKLSRSRREIPEATVWVDVDATDLLAARAQLNAADPDRPISVLALIARFVVEGLRRYPELNGRIEGAEIVLPRAVHLGFAAQTPRGLLVPVVSDAQSKSARDLSAAIAALTERARSGSATPADLSGGTFTVNNYGVFGVDGSAAIINHPEIAILGIGRIMDRPWAVDGQLAIRKLTQLTLAFDHRACDGGSAGGLLRFIADCVEAPIRVLGDL